MSTPPKGRYARLRQRWERWRDSHNMVLILCALAASSRGILYTVPTNERVPPALSLLPQGALSIYGVFWLGVALYGFLHSRDDKPQRMARRFLAGMPMAWASIYVAGIFLADGQVIGFGANAVFFTIIAGFAWASKPKIQYREIFIVHGQNTESGFVMLVPEHDGDDNAARTD